MFRTFVLLVALFALSAYARPLTSMINGSIPIGTLSANKWNQTSFTLNPEVAGTPIGSIWFYFADINTAKPLPTTIFQRGSITVTTSNQSLSVYNALTDSLNVPRVFPAAYPLWIPTGTITVKASWALNIGQPDVSATLSWAIATALPTNVYAQHANMMVQGWSSTGVYSSSVTAALPYTGQLVFAVGNILSGGQKVVIQNNSTGSVICTSAVSTSGDMVPCTPNVQIPQGTKITVTIFANGTFEPNAGGADFYIAKLPPPPTTTTTTTATHSTAGTSSNPTTGTHGTTSNPTTGTHGTTGNPTTGTHSTAGPTGPSSTHSTSGGPTGPSSSDGHSSQSSQSTGQSTQSSTGQSTAAASTTTSSVSMGYSSGSSGSGGTGGGNGFLADVDSIFVQKFDNKKTKIVINDVKERDAQQVLDIAEIDELPSADPDHFRVTEEKASNKFL